MCQGCRADIRVLVKAHYGPDQTKQNISSLIPVFEECLPGLAGTTCKSVLQVRRRTDQAHTQYRRLHRGSACAGKTINSRLRGCVPFSPGIHSWHSSCHNVSKTGHDTVALCYRAGTVSKAPGLARCTLLLLSVLHTELRLTYRRPGSVCKRANSAWCALQRNVIPPTP